MRDSFWPWYWRLPSPFTKEDLDAGYVYEPAFRQFEVSDTVIFDRPQAGRAWFEGVIRDHLDIGRPDQVALIFQKRIRRRTLGPFRTRVITRGVEPILTCYSRSSRLKQCFKGGSEPAYRGRHLRYPRLRYRAPRLRQELECPSGCWRIRQPAFV